jgi:hypothetical protein
MPLLEDCVMISRFIFENSLLSPFWASLFAGYAEVGWDGRVYLTAAGEEYLRGLE